MTSAMPGDRMPRVTALLGSPRREGNTHLMARAVLEGARAEGATATEVFLDEYEIRPAGEVGDAKPRRIDSRQDDEFVQVLHLFLRAQLVVWASPVYWQGLTAQLKSFCDRLGAYFRHPDYVERFRGKHHVAVCAFERPDARHHRWVTEAVQLTAEYLGGEYSGHVYAPGTYEKGAVQTKAGTLLRCRELGARSVRRMSRPTS